MPAPLPPPGRDVIVVGASAGGVQALTELLRGFPPDLPAAVFVVVHTSPTSPGILPQILDRAGPLRAAHAIDGEQICHGRVYVAPPDHHLLIKNGTMRVVRGPKENGFRPAVDPLFRTAARVAGPRAVGVILSGSLDDGTEGLMLIKEYGGVSVVQDPAEATFPGMPASAIACAAVDHVLRVGEMPALLTQLASEPLPEGVNDMSGQNGASSRGESDVAEVGDVSLLAGDLPGPPSGCTCPECGGALWELRAGKLMKFRCHVGHAYSADALVAEQTRDLEASLWTALRALEESAALRRRMARRARTGSWQALAQDYERQAVDAEARASLIRRTLMSEAPQTETIRAGDNDSPRPAWDGRLYGKGGNGRSEARKPARPELTAPAKAKGRAAGKGKGATQAKRKGAAAGKAGDGRKRRVAPGGRRSRVHMAQKKSRKAPVPRTPPARAPDRAKRAAAAPQPWRPERAASAASDADPLAPQGPLPEFVVVAVGANAGAVEPCTEILAGLPADLDAAVVVVQHLAPRKDVLVPERLARRCKLPVVAASHGMALKRGRVHVIPPGAEMVVADRKFRLAPAGGGGNGKSPGPPAPFLPIDLVFRSVAAYAATRAVGVVLSGTTDDGARGLLEIKAGGGIAIVQDPRTAASNAMPRAAILAGAADLVLPPAKIAAEIVDVTRRATGGAAADGDDGDGVPVVAADPHLARIFYLLHEATGVDFTHYKLPTVRRRLQRRLVLHKLPSLDAYVRYLRENPAEVGDLYQDMLINVTHFFRDPESFDTLAKKAFPGLLAARGRNDPVRVWVPGCSSGEEAYSVAIALHEYLGDAAPAVTVQVFATDIADRLIDSARAGSFPESVAADVSPERLRRYFTKTDGHYRVGKMVRDMVVFGRQDLSRDPPFSRLDMIVCRNVLIYLGPALQRRLMTVFHYALKPGGFLMLGAAETVGTQADLFDLVEKRSRLYVKKAAAARVDVAFTAPQAPGGRLPAAAPRPSGGARPAPTVQSEANRVLLSRYTPPGVVVDADYQIVQFRGHTGPYLEPAPGDASLSLLKMAREGVLHALRSALLEARSREGPVRREGLRVRHDNEYRDVNVEVTPLVAPGEPRHYLVLFQDPARGAPRPEKGAAAPAGPAAAKGKGKNGPAGPRDPRVERLEAELAGSREYMQSIIQDLEAANEELQSANEEILSANEELQSTNEELDTAKEELQSTNEELNTLNDELQGRNEELSRVNSDLVNLLGNVPVAIVMIDQQLRVRRFTPAAERLLNLIPTDVGRPISDIRPNVNCEDMGGLITEVISSLEPRERECRDAEGRWYSLRVRPYKDLDNRIDGAVVALVDVNDARRHVRETAAAGDRAKAADERAHVAEERAHAAHARADDADTRARATDRRRDYAHALFDAAAEPTVVLDVGLNVVGANSAFRRRFGLQSGDGAGRPVAEAAGDGWGAAPLRQLLEKVASDGPDAAADAEFHLPAGGRARFHVSARRVSDGDRAPLVVVTLAESGDGSNSPRPRADAGRKQ